MIRPDETPPQQLFDAIWDALVKGDLARLDNFATSGPFPHGTDDWLGSHWLSTAVECGNPASLAWVLRKGPQINYVDTCGFTALYMALRHEASPELESAAATALTITLLDLLLDAGAEINLRARLKGPSCTALRGFHPRRLFDICWRAVQTPLMQQMSFHAQPRMWQSFTSDGRFTQFFAREWDRRPQACLRAA